MDVAEELHNELVGLPTRQPIPIDNEGSPKVDTLFGTATSFVDDSGRSPEDNLCSTLIAPVGGSSFPRPNSYETLRKRPKSSHSRIPSPLSTIIDLETEKTNNDSLESVHDISDEHSSSSTSLKQENGKGKGKAKDTDTDTDSRRSIPSSLGRTRPSSVHGVTRERPSSPSLQRRVSVIATSRDPNVNWMTAAPSTTPVFTRAQISARDVVMPLSPSELVRKKTQNGGKVTMARPRTAMVRPVVRNNENELPARVRQRANTLGCHIPPPIVPPPSLLMKKSSWTSKIFIHRTPPASPPPELRGQPINDASHLLDSLVPPSPPSPLATSPTPSSTSFSSLLSSKSAASTNTSISSFETEMIVMPATSTTSAPSCDNEIGPRKWPAASNVDAPCVSPPSPYRAHMDVAVLTKPALDDTETVGGVALARAVVDVVVHPDDDSGYGVGPSAAGAIPTRTMNAVVRVGAANVSGRRDGQQLCPPSKDPAPAPSIAKFAKSAGSGSISKKFKGAWKKFFC
ncbi:hypothetical protein BS47DRAFT_1360530 [Hydnum rufescens UP504]|uniref:Uncharacterized protein n=1 Tax=Hydnum rufescens UP504 TaxID=1448309 RepID=A0A9P6DYM8_9AGAM|nr:hypothetical protein BS47DRAFT_1360530 [Hydnum rufescens UP504]